MVKCGVIGYGSQFDMGKWHGVWMERAGFALSAVCDTDPARLEAAKAEFPAIATFLDYHDLLATDVEVVAVVLPHNLHASVGVDCLKAGKHTVLEKPMCLTVGEVDRVLAAQGDRVLSVFHNRRWDGDYRVIREIVRGGEVGDVFRIECSFGSFEPPKEWWRSDRSISGGTIYDFGAHMIDWILGLVDSPVAEVRGSRVDGVWGAGTEDHSGAWMSFEDGCTAEIEATYLKSVAKPKWRILGTNGGITADWGPSVSLHTWNGKELVNTDRACGEDDWGAFYRNLAAHLRGEEPLAVTALQARHVVAVLEAATK